MGDEDNDEKYPNWKWLLMLALGLVAWLAIQGFSTLSASIEKKVDKEVYEAEKQQDRKDIAEIKRMVTCVYEWHLPPELRRKGGGD